MFNNWTNNEFLVDHFIEYKKDLESGYYSEKEISRAVGHTIREAVLLKAKLFDATKNRSLGDLFVPLTKGKTGNSPTLIKAYGVTQKTKLRLYAVKLEDDSFIICGGAIKLTKAMAEAEELKLQKVRLNNLRDFLRKEGISDAEQLEELILEL